MLRFAPSPTGDMHIGNLRAAIFNYILAKQRNEKFLIRIEDTDMARNIPGKDKEILSLLNLFGLFWDSLVYQSHNFSKHQQFAEFLLQNNKAFYCYCSKEFLEQKKQEAIEQKIPFRYDDSWAEICKDSTKKPVIRLRGSQKPITYRDEIKGEITFEPNELDSFVIIREDGIPTYNFACACDDMIYDIDYIVRGEDHVSNTPKQLLIRQSLGYDKHIQFAHLPIILGQDGKKMSKRDKASSVVWLLEEGFLPVAISNYLIAMGNAVPHEIFTLSEAIEWFDIKKIAKSPVKFDLAKLRFINHAHLKNLNESDLSMLLDSSSTPNLSLGALARIYLEEASTLNELREKIEAIFAPKDIAKLYEGQDFSKECMILYNILCAKKQNLPLEYEEFKQLLMKESNLKGKAFFKPLRIVLSGASCGPELHQTYPYLRLMIDKILSLKN
ncbi:glutamate--tRNA ligase [uncultured Helicobacter sp.]|uniref:glutamate--tRNA ligase n=1 Tax=uncultured Helicobacter sp. TaxID=175537 RepID=UPI0027DCC94D|nr:glutamate--tRNA ligase [uncultured Helicobacter sp.]